MKRCVVIGLIGVLVFAGAIEWWGGPRGAGAVEQEVEETRGQPNVDRTLLEQLTADAAHAYEATKASYEVGTSVMADVYVWSRRWLDAERNLAQTDADEIASLRAHRERMKNLFLKVNALFMFRVKGAEPPKFFAAKYYLAEADVWLAAAKSRDAAKPAPIKNVSISFDGPKGMTVTWDEKGQGAFDSEPLVCPGAHEFVEGQIYRLRLREFRVATNLKFSGTLELMVAGGGSFQIEISPAELKKIVENNTGLTKVFYRTDDSRTGAVSGEWNERPLVAEAEGLGEVLAILHLSQGG